MRIQHVYLDEAGHTGANLLDSAQPVFVYAAVAIDESQALAIHEKAIRHFRISAPELKGTALLKRPRGRDAISWLLEATSQHTRIVAINKEYALAGKFFEYVFEPALAKHNSFFYSINFHRFIAMLLYIHSRAGDARGRRMLEGFQLMMRETDDALLEPFLTGGGIAVEENNPLDHVTTFALCNKETIKREIRLIKAMGSARGWPLELSTTSVSWLLASWAEEFEALRVRCDASKPIAEDLAYFRNFLGREDKAYVWFGQQNNPKNNPSYIYNLAEPVQLVDSLEFPGVQIADIWASALAYAFKNDNEAISRKWLALAKDVTSNVISPDAKLIDLNLSGPIINTRVLIELSQRSVEGDDLFLGMDDLVLNAQADFESMPETPIGQGDLS